MSTRASFALAFALTAGAANAETQQGKEIFNRVCAECHAPGFGHPGTQRLGWRSGEAAAVLEQRRDLHPDYVRYVVRHGLAEMPPIRPTEISDQELAALVAYLANK